MTDPQTEQDGDIPAASNLADQLSRGEHAARILNDPLVQEAFATIESGLRDKMFETGARESDDREKIWQMHHSFNEFRRFFIETFETGKLAEFTVKKATQKKRANMSER